MPRLTPEQLEARLHAALQQQPLRRAPSSLEHRVLAEIARREALPWWRKSFAHWPVAMQVAFLLVSVVVAGAAGLAGLYVFGGSSLQATLSVATQPVFEAWSTLRAAGGALTQVAADWVPSIPSTWMYAALAAAGLCYVTALGLGATAYRLLWQPR